MLQKDQEKLLERIRGTVRKDETLLQKLDAIASIKSVGELTALILLHLFLCYPDANQRQIVSLAGLDLVMRESGSFVKGRVKISKAGDKIYREALFMPAMGMIYCRTQVIMQILPI